MIHCSLIGWRVTVSCDQLYRYVGYTGQPRTTLYPDIRHFRPETYPASQDKSNGNAVYDTALNQDINDPQQYANAQKTNQGNCANQSTDRGTRLDFGSERYPKTLVWLRTSTPLASSINASSMIA
jgi:hypothetical protein